MNCFGAVTRILISILSGDIVLDIRRGVQCNTRVVIIGIPQHQCLSVVPAFTSHRYFEFVSEISANRHMYFTHFLSAPRFQQDKGTKEISNSIFKVHFEPPQCKSLPESLQIYISQSCLQCKLNYLLIRQNLRTFTVDFFYIFENCLCSRLIFKAAIYFVSELIIFWNFLRHFSLKWTQILSVQIKCCTDLKYKLLRALFFIVKSVYNYSLITSHICQLLSIYMNFIVKSFFIIFSAFYHTHNYSWLLTFGNK